MTPKDFAQWLDDNVDHYEIDSADGDSATVWDPRVLDFPDPIEMVDAYPAPDDEPPEARRDSHLCYEVRLT